MQMKIRPRYFVCVVTLKPIEFGKESHLKNLKSLIAFEQWVCTKAGQCR